MIPLNPGQPVLVQVATDCGTDYRQIRQNALPGFMPAESLFSSWPGARRTLERLLPPECVAFGVAPHDPNLVEVDSRWALEGAYEALELGGQEAKDRLVDCLRQWLAHFQVSENMAGYSQFLAQAIDPRTINQINDVFQQHERERKNLGWHTMHDALLHFTGLRNASVFTHIKITTTVVQR